MFKKTALSVLCVIIVFVSVLAVPTSAVTYQTFNVPMSQPNTSDTVGYVELYTYNTDLKEYYATVVVLTIPQGAYIDVQMSANNMIIQCINPTGDNLTMGSYYVDSYNRQGVINSNIYGVMDYDYAHHIINGYHIYAGFRFITNVFGVGLYPFVVEYGNSNNTADKINQQQQQFTQDIINNENNNTQQIIGNQQDNTQQIIDNQNQIVENEKQESNATGQGSVDSVSDIIPNESEGFINALKKLTVAMSYSGTSAKWQLPSIKLPAIKGVMDEVVLTDDLQIDFEKTINTYIPSNILTLIRNLLTVGLIVFCVKELYNLIQYALTLKGGNTNE